MFYYINGTVAEIQNMLAVVDCGGVGYALNTTVNTLAALKVGEKAKLYTYLNVREDCFDIYGFATLSEKHCFELLIGVSGVGPKAALSILSANTPDALAMAILTEDEKALMVAQGIGKKIAQRVILELKDKMSKQSPELAKGATVVPGTAPTGSNKATDAAAALAVLGYGSAEISAALKGIDVDNLALEDIIKQALRKMVK
ncbi:MAG: Holliday junction branch migration protein RuvA [Oscillospiraceae bacterium]|nr:Holliday junction branch migration protein RuvA [Oscillospiraceae bacterium]